MHLELELITAFYLNFQKKIFLKFVKRLQVDNDLYF
jgi:hypothetical protein